MKVQGYLCSSTKYDECLYPESTEKDFPYSKYAAVVFKSETNQSIFPHKTMTQILTILLTFFKIVVRPLITKENLYLEILIRHSLLCSVLTLVCVFCCPVFIGS